MLTLCDYVLILYEKGIFYGNFFLENILLFNKED